MHLIKEDDIDDPSVNPWPDTLIGSSPGQVLTSASDTGNIIILGAQYGG